MFDENSMKRFVSELSQITGFPDNLMEKDVWQKLVLQKLYSDKEIQGKLVFKGGTCITRTLLGYYRFSEDLDFAWNARQSRTFHETFSRNYIEPLAGIGARAGRKYGTLGGRLMKWDLLCGSGKLVLSVNFSQELAFPAQDREVSTINVSADESRKLAAIYPDIFSAYCAKLIVPCYSPQEIACEKFAAILTRKDLAKPRDLVDLFHLGKTIDLRALSQEKKSVGKASGMIKSAPAYLSAFRERKKDVRAYLGRLVDGALLESEIYIEHVDADELRQFASETLAPILEELVKETVL